jgi:hypothetical protein
MGHRSLNSDGIRNHNSASRGYLAYIGTKVQKKTGGGMMDATDDGGSFCERGLRGKLS